MRQTTLINILQDRSLVSDKGINFIESGDSEYFMSYQDLYDSALRALGYLQDNGIKSQNELVFQIDDNKTFVITYWACILGGIIPVPLTVGQTDDHKQKFFNIWTILNDPYVILSEQGLSLLADYASKNLSEFDFSEAVNRQVDQYEILNASREGEIYNAEPEDIAFIQFSSGSTGSPKGVILTHENLITNVIAIAASAAYTSDDSMISWMPLTHDMGLIGFHINPLYIGMNQHLMPTNLFVRRPALWLDKTSEYKVSILCSPNFGYKYVLKHCNFDQVGWDLSSVRVLYNGAEPISMSLCEEFVDKMEDYSLRRTAMCPVYGLAEASLAVSMSKLDDAVISYHFDRNKLNFGDEVSVEQSSEHAVSFVNVGRPVNDCHLRIADTDNVEVPAQVIGNIQIKGRNVTSGYYNNQEATENALVGDGWLNTGDMGFIRDGALYVTGRIKDIIFVNGQNFYPHDIERYAEDVEGIELNKIAVVGHFNEDLQKEEVMAFVFHRGGLNKFIPVLKEIVRYINLKIGFELDKVIPVKDIPRTTSGKLQRFKLLQLYIEGAYKDIEDELSEMLAEMEDVRQYVAPANETERKISDMWCHVLGVEKVSVVDKFFELGGNSLKAAEMAMQFVREFELKIPLDALYKTPTIRAMSDSFGEYKKSTYQPIPRAFKKRFYKLSPIQNGIFYSWQVNKASTAYNMPAAFQLNGIIDIEKLHNCLSILVQRHDSLRMSFLMQDEPKFSISTEADFVYDVVACETNELNRTLKALVKPFDLYEDLLFRAYVVDYTERNVLLLDFHHIISDGLSVYNFIEELSALYSGETLIDIEANYIDFAAWKSNTCDVEPLQLSKNFWLNSLKGDLPILDLPIDNNRPIVFDSSGEKLEFEINAQLSAGLKEIAFRNNCSLHALLYSVYAILLSKYTAQEELVIGIPAAGREHPDLQRVHGMFVNNLAIRTTVNYEVSFLEFANGTHNQMQQSLAHQHYPFSKLVEDLGGARNMSRNPVFDTMFVYQNMGMPESSAKSLSMQRHFFDPGFSKFDISMEVFDYKPSIGYYIEYATALFNKETILRFQKHFQRLLENVCKNPSAKIAQLDMITEIERQWLVHEFNNSQRDIPSGKTICHLFEEQVYKSPDAVAIEHKDSNISYSELKNKVDSLCVKLSQSSVSRGDAVAVLLPRSAELIISILAIMKSGGCYMPLDTSLPEERVSYILRHSQCKYAITSDAYEGVMLDWHLKNGEVTLTNIDRFSFGVVKENIDIKSTLSDLAYIIYTSGTTGKPKGVMIEHHALTNYITWANDNYVKGGAGAFPLYTSISFDLTITSIFTPLISGNRLVIYEEDGNELMINRIITENKVDVIKLTPSHLRLVYESKLDIADSAVKRFIVGGEELDRDLAGKIQRRFHGNVEIINEYGPTEATVGCMIYRYNEDDDALTVPIGQPAANTQIYLLDKNLNPVPTGVKGEIYVAGNGLAKGYMFNDELTAERFISNVFQQGQRMYKTGDVARRLNSGMLEFIGRIDHQVKINGYRIELSEIESNLMAFKGIDSALAVAKVNDKNKKVIYAYFVSEAEVNIANLRNFLVAKLPHYMIPMSFIRLDMIPLTANGKVDVKALPNKAEDSKSQNDTPKNKVESISLEVWKEIFKVSDLRISDNFFELGGDSIKAVQIASKLNEQGISVEVRDILSYHTIEQVSLHAEAISGNQNSQEKLTGERAFTPIENWFVSQEQPDSQFYTQSVLLPLNNRIDLKAAEEAINAVVSHHDALTSKVVLNNGKCFYGKASEALALTTHRAANEKELTYICQQKKSEISIDGAMLKMALIDMSDGSSYLFITAHHFVVDGISWRIILEDFYKSYMAIEKGEQPQLPLKTSSLINWADQLNIYSEKLNIANAEKYWNKIDEVKFKVPQDFDTDDWTVKQMATSKVTLTEELTQFLIKKAHTPYNTDVPTILNVALANALHDWTKQYQFVVEHENHGRHLEDLSTSRTVGWFTAMYPVLLELPEGDASMKIKAIKEQMRSVPDHGLSYGVLKHMLNTHKPERREIRFNYLGQFDGALDNDLFSLSNMNHGPESSEQNYLTAKMEMNLLVVNNELKVELTYNKLAHSISTINNFMSNYMSHLTQLLNDIRGEGDIHFTPSDFDSAELSEEDLDVLFS